MEADNPHSSEPYSPERKTARFVSTQQMTVAILKQHQAFAYGVVTNNSEGGACLMTDAESLSGRIRVLLSFYNAEIVTIEARAVWTGGSEQGLVGVEFLGVSESAADRLETILHSLTPSFGER